MNMNTNNIDETVLALVKELTGDDTKSITMDENLSNVGFNSLVFIKMVVIMEDTFHFVFDDEMLDYNNYQTLQDISDYISLKIAN